MKPNLHGALLTTARTWKWPYCPTNGQRNKDVVVAGVWSLSCVWLLLLTVHAAPWTAAHQASWSFTISYSLLKKMWYICPMEYYCCLVAKLCLILSDPMDCSPPGSSVHGISPARTLEWAAISFSRGPSWPGIRPMPPALQAASSPLSHLERPLWNIPQPEKGIQMCHL